MVNQPVSLAGRHSPSLTTSWESRPRESTLQNSSLISERTTADLDTSRSRWEGKLFDVILILSPLRLGTRCQRGQSLSSAPGWDPTCPWWRRPRCRRTRPCSRTSSPTCPSSCWWRVLASSPWSISKQKLTRQEVPGKNHPPLASVSFSTYVT